MTPTQRKIILMDKDRNRLGKKISQKFIADEEGVTLSAVNNVLHDRTKSTRLCINIAEKYMGLPVYIVWPLWFKKSECISTLNNLPNEPVCVNGKP